MQHDHFVGRIGLFPDNFVKPYDGASSDKAEGTEQLKKQMICIFAYAAQSSDELTLKVGDIVTVLGTDTDGWLKGELKGLFVLLV